jgi:hypothetical protein
MKRNSSRHAKAITPHDTNPINPGGGPTSSIYVGGAGNITCRLVDSTADVLFTGLLAGTVLDVQATHVRATGTTATALVAMY